MQGYSIHQEFDPETGTITIKVTGQHLPPEGHLVAVRDPAATTRAELLDVCQRTADEVRANYVARASAAALTAPSA